MKNKGSSLVYVLILLSVLSILSLGYMSFVNNKNKILKLEKVKLDREILKKRLIKKEKRQIQVFNSKKYAIYSYIFFLMNTDYEIRNYKKDYASYFEEALIIGKNNSVIYDTSQISFNDHKNIKKAKLIYLNKNAVSVGGFKIDKIISNGNILMPPLERKDYGRIQVIYRKNILDTDIYIKQYMIFRKNKKNRYVGYDDGYEFLENKE